jgi:Icc-related predicted phosphoesterase
MFWKRKAEGTTIFFCSDLHGSTVCFKKFINSAAYYSSRGRHVDMILMGGDMTGKLIVPIIKQAGEYRSYLFGKEHTLTTQEDLDGLIKKTEVLGVYPHIFEPDEYEEFRGSKPTQDELFKKLMLKRLEEWMDFAERKLSDNGTPCYMSPGNDDIPEVNAILTSSSIVSCPDNSVIRITDDHEMMSLGNSNLTPFNCPRDLPEEELTQMIEALSPSVQDMSNCIFNMHCPPFDTGIDEAPILDEELRPRIGIQGVEMAPVGCQAVRQAIEKYQPLLGLHGHIHESKGAATLGRTLCINPGSEYSEGVLRGALVTIKKGKVLSHMFTSG